MTDEKIELVDRDYNNCPRDNPSRQIRTRNSSFNSIRERFNAWRLRRLKNKLDDKKRQALTSGYTEQNFRDKIGKNADVIARLEEKIMILSKEDVPENYVARRAIKLRKKMIENLTYNTGVYYSVGMIHYDDVFGEEKKVEKKEEKKEEKAAPATATTPDKKEGMAAATPTDKKDPINVVPSDLERKEIVDAVNSSFDELEKKPLTPAAGVISKADVKEVIDEKLNQGDKAAVPKVEDAVIDKATIKEAVQEAFDKEKGSEPVSKPVVNVVPRDTKPATAEARVVSDRMADEPVIQESHPVEETTNNSADANERIMEAIRRVQVSRNNGRAVKASLFDENGNRVEKHKKYDYKPMTDEEIRASQIKLGFDEHGNLLSSNKPKTETVSTARVVGNFVAPGSIPSVKFDEAFVPVKKSNLQEVPLRDQPVVVPDRQADLGLEMEDGENMFELIDQAKPEKAPEPVRAVARDAETNMTIDDYNALKEKILHLQEQKQITRKNREEAQKRAEEAARKAQEAKEQYERSQADYNARMQKLRDYTAQLEADCDEEVRMAEAANRDARMSEGLAQQQRSGMDETRRRIEEIDSMLAETNATEVRHTFGK